MSKKPNIKPAKSDVYSLETLIGQLLSQDRLKDLDSLQENLAYLDNNWLGKHQSFRDFTSEFGHGKVPALYKCENGFTLGAWVQSQRTLHKRGALKLERQLILDSTPMWIWKLRMTPSWSTSFACLESYYKETGKVNLPAAYKTKEGFALGEWHSTQRILYAKGKLDTEKIRLLESLSGWSWESLHENWVKSFEALKCFIEREKRLPDTREKCMGRAVGRFVTANRSTRHIIKDSDWSRKKVALLEALPGWSWEKEMSELDRNWHRSFEHLCRFIDLHGRLPKNKEKFEGQNLGKWRFSQYLKKTDGRLSEIQRDKLESLPLWTWGVLTDSWERKFEQLQQCWRGSAKPPLERESRVWAQKQREMRNQRTPDQLCKLESLPGWSWTPKEDRWWIRFDEVKEHFTLEGSLPVSSSLGAWVRTQRGRHRRGKLEADRIAALKTLPGVLK